MPFSHQQGTNIQAPSGLSFGRGELVLAADPGEAGGQHALAQTGAVERTGNIQLLNFAGGRRCIEEARRNFLVLVSEALVFPGSKRNADVSIASVRIRPALSGVNRKAGGEAG
jgi:hypothetical protein